MVTVLSLIFYMYSSCFLYLITLAKPSTVSILLSHSKTFPNLTVENNNLLSSDLWDAFKLSLVVFPGDHLSSCNEMAAVAGVLWRFSWAGHNGCFFTDIFGVSAGMAGTVETGQSSLFLQVLLCMSNFLIYGILRVVRFLTWSLVCSRVSV